MADTYRTKHAWAEMIAGGRVLFGTITTFRTEDKPTSAEAARELREIADWLEKER